jgi:signal transduction histidine kinase
MAVTVAFITASFSTSIHSHPRESVQTVSTVKQAPGGMSVAVRCSIALLAFCLCGLQTFQVMAASPSSAQASRQRLSQMGHSVWRVQDGQFPAVTAVAQTQDGYLWLGTVQGLVRFDGVRFLRWNTFPEASTAEWNVTAMLAARDGSLWIGTTGRTVARLRSGRLEKAVAGGTVSQFAEDASGQVWFGLIRTGGEGVPLCRMTGEEIQCVDRSELPMPFATALAVAPGGGLWVGGSQLCRWQPGAQAQCYMDEALKPLRNLSGVKSTLVTRDGHHWVGTARGDKDLGLGELVNGRWKPVVATDLNAESLSVVAMLEDRTGAVWVGTDDRGIYRIRDGRAEHLDSAAGLSSNSVSSMLEDREGTVWVATSNGLDAFRAIPVNVFSMREGLEADIVQSVLPTADGGVWIGGLQLARLVDDRVAPLPQALRVAGENVTSMLEDHAGRLWIGLKNNLHVFEDGRLVRVAGPAGGETRAIESMAEDAKHRIWAVTIGPNPQLLRFSSQVEVEVLDHPDCAIVRSMAPDAAGGMWLGCSDSTLIYARDDQWTAYPSELAAKQPIRKIALGPEGLVAAATVRGILLQKAGKQWALNVAAGLPCSRTISVVFDQQQDLWVSASCGLIRVWASDLASWMARPEGKVALRLFDATDGVRMGEGAFFTPIATKAPDGRLWFATGRVAQVIDPAQVASPNAAPAIQIEEIVADRTAYQVQDLVRLPARARDLEIHYTALSFLAPQRIRFRYRLEGHDDAWRDANNRRVAYYSDLPPGNYRLRVQAAASDGAWTGRPSEVAFVIPPLFYQTTWFSGVCLASGGALLYVLYLVRVRRLESGLRDRLSAKIAERERIARELHDTFLQSTQALVLRLHAAAAEFAPDSPVRERLEETVKRAEAVMEEGRDRVLDLRLPSESLADLPQALAAAGAELTKLHPAKFQTTVEGVRRELDPRVGDSLYNIGREALVNAFRHARASAIEVQVVYLDDALSLRICDDGVGIAPETLAAGYRPGHWGLKGLNERARDIGAGLQVWSRPDAGTEIEVKIDAAIAYLEPTRSTVVWLRRMWRSAAA